MNRLGLIIVAAMVAGMAGGCAGQRAALTGHDFVDEAVAALRAGLAEYHLQDAERLAIARRQVAEAFAADVAAAAGDGRAAAELTGRFLSILEGLDRSAGVEAERRRRMERWLVELVNVNASLRQQAEWRLGVDEQLGQYMSALRERVYGRSTFTTD